MEPTLDMIRTIAIVAQAVALGAAAWVGIRGLNAWRRQLVGGKRVQLAEEALVTAYDAVNAIERIRNPIRFSGEGETRDNREAETENVRQEKDTYFTTIERIKSERKKFDRLDRIKIQCRIHFGEEVVQHFNSIHRTPIRIVVAARSLMRLVEEPELHSTEKQKKHADMRKKREKIIWDMSDDEEPDQISQNLRTALQSLESALLPYLRE